jgi:hypothetical protein
LQKLTNKVFDTEGNLKCGGDEVDAEIALVCESVNTICSSFGSKIEIPLMPEDEDRHLVELFDDDENLTLNLADAIEYLDKETLRIIAVARSLLVRLFEPYEEPSVTNGVWDRKTSFDFWDMEFRPKPGPGAVLEGYSAYGKYDRFFTAAPLKAIRPLGLFEIAFPLSGCPNGNSPLIFTGEHIRDTNGGERYAKTRIVPKKYGVGRVIMLQDNDMMFLQKGYQANVYKWVERHPLTKGLVNFTDQTINGKLALSSSLTREWATLDLRKASDLVTKWHIGLLFDERVAEMLLLLRSDRMKAELTDGSELDSEMNMYAAMGSALCFPVEALVFWAICTAALKVAGLDSTAYVFGDDLIVPNDGYEAVTRALGHVGFIVNRKKSFTKGHFRESCGVDAFKGRRVNPPFRIKKRVPSTKYLTREQRQKSVVAWVEYANLAEKSDFIFLAESLRETLRYYVPSARSFPETGDCTEITEKALVFYVDRCPYTVRRPKRKAKLTSTFTYVPNYPGWFRDYCIKDPNSVPERFNPTGGLILRKLDSVDTLGRGVKEVLSCEVPNKEAQGHFFGPHLHGASRNLYVSTVKTEVHPRQSAIGSYRRSLPGHEITDKGKATMPDGLAMLRYWFEQCEDTTVFSAPGHEDSFDVKRERCLLT